MCRPSGRKPASTLLQAAKTIAENQAIPKTPIMYRSLCIRGGMLEKFIERPDILSDDQIMQLLSFAFHKNDVQGVLRQMIEEAEKREQGETL